MTINNKLLFYIEHGDWYKDQHDNNRENYLKFEVTRNEQSGMYGLHYVTLFAEVSDGGYTAEEIISRIKSSIARKEFNLEDFTFNECYGLKEYPESREYFLEIISPTIKN